jgi:hypothetical protein
MRLRKVYRVIFFLFNFVSHIRISRYLAYTCTHVSVHFCYLSFLIKSVYLFSFEQMIYFISSTLPEETWRFPDKESKAMGNW